jgi:hypothetical protein
MIFDASKKKNIIYAFSGGRKYDDQFYPSLQ